MKEVGWILGGVKGEMHPAGLKILLPSKRAMAQADRPCAVPQEHCSEAHTLDKLPSCVEDGYSDLIVVGVGRLGSQSIPRPQGKNLPKAEARARLLGDSDVDAAVSSTKT